MGIVALVRMVVNVRPLSYQVRFYSVRLRSSEAAALILGCIALAINLVIVTWGWLAAFCSVGDYVRCFSLGYGCMHKISRCSNGNDFRVHGI